MTNLQNFAMDESQTEAPTCTQSGGSVPEEQTLERTGSMPDRTISLRDSGRQSSAARKVGLPSSLHRRVVWLFGS